MVSDQSVGVSFIQILNKIKNWKLTPNVIFDFQKRKKMNLKDVNSIKKKNQK